MADQANRGVDNGVIYEQPPPYEFQTVSLDFDHDDKVDGEEDVQTETPVFVDGNKVNKSNYCCVIFKQTGI